MTITSANSNYHFYTSQNNTQNTSLAQKITQTNTATNLANLVLDKSESLSEVLGYGVDSKGYFTSDFNKIAGIPQDYKIHSDITKYFDKISNYHLAPFQALI